MKLREELERAQEEKRELEQEIKCRNEEIYQMNERLLLQEINSSSTLISDPKVVQELQAKMDRIYDANVRRVTDMSKLRQCLERLKCDLHVMYLSKKLNRSSNEDTAEDGGNQE